MDKAWVLIVLAAASATWGGWAISATIGAWKQKREDEAGDGAGLSYRVRQLQQELDAFKGETARRFDHAGKDTSDAWSYVQGIESKFIREFAPRDLTDERFAQNKLDHDRLHADIGSLRHRE